MSTDDIELAPLQGRVDTADWERVGPYVNQTGAGAAAAPIPRGAEVQQQPTTEQIDMAYVTVVIPGCFGFILIVVGYSIGLSILKAVGWTGFFMMMLALMAQRDVAAYAFAKMRREAPAFIANSIEPVLMTVYIAASAGTFCMLLLTFIDPPLSKSREFGSIFVVFMFIVGPGTLFLVGRRFRRSPPAVAA